tara:strand:- start:902 stop:1159 length:258 start_codon:yes stop_codon:yes gene_type:complete
MVILLGHHLFSNKKSKMKRNDDWITELHYKEFIRPKLHPTDFYWEEGKMVLTEEYHKKRGHCCGNNCRHCPYQPNNQLNNKVILQ